MKKKFLALVSAMALTIAMSITVCAAPSSTASDNSGSSSSAGSTSTSTVAQESLATSTQQFSNATLVEFASTTTIESGVAGATITAVSEETAASAIAQAQSVAGSNAFVAAVFDLNASEAGTFTIGCPNVWAGQKVIILHQLSNGTWETITPSSVENNKVTFTMTSYSPVAIVVDTTAGKTGDVAPIIAIMAVTCLAGAVVFGKKKAVN